jgi:hypothetical protein
MGMIRHQCPSVASGLGFRQELGQPFDEIFTIFILPENLAAFYPSDHNMM